MKTILILLNDYELVPRNHMLPVHRIFVSIVIAFLLAGCSTKTKDKVLDPELFSQIYVELVLQSAKSTDSDSLDQLQAVLEEFKVTREEFEASVSYFQNNPELWLEVFTQVVKDLEEREKAAGKSESGDTKNLE
ncbi:MAG: DUF4296 domain-containing protein [bacterium]